MGPVFLYILCQRYKIAHAQHNVSIAGQCFLCNIGDVMGTISIADGV